MSLRHHHHSATTVNRTRRPRQRIEGDEVVPLQVVHVQDQAHHRPGRLSLADGQLNLVAHLKPLVGRDLGVKEDSAAVPRQKPAAAEDARAEHLGIGRHRPEKDLALLIPGQRQLGPAPIPNLRTGHAGHVIGHLDQAHHAIQAVKYDQYVEAEVVEHYLKGVVHRSTHAHHDDEHHTAEHQRDQCQRDARFAPDGVAQAERQWAGQAADPPDQPVEPVASKPSPQAVVADGLVGRDPCAADHRHQRRQQGHDQSHPNLNAECGWHQAKRTDRNVENVEQHARQQVGGDGP